MAKRVKNTSGKFGYFCRVTNVDKKVNTDSSIEYTATMRDGSKDVLTYFEGESTEKVKMYSLNKRGKVYLNIKPNKRGEYRVNRNNSQTAVNEIIWQFENMWRGLPPVEGEYNHHLPICWQIKHYGHEVASVDGGDVCDRHINEKHWHILARIAYDTGRQYRMASDAANLVDWLISNKILYGEDYDDILTTLEASGDIELMFKN